MSMDKVVKLFILRPLLLLLEIVLSLGSFPLLQALFYYFFDAGVETQATLGRKI
jgi:hypothetical protein